MIGVYAQCLLAISVFAYKHFGQPIAVSSREWDLSDLNMLITVSRAEVFFFCHGLSVERMGTMIPESTCTSPEYLDSDPASPVILARQTVIKLDCHRISLINQVAFSHEYGWNQ